jgi:hypothetical protein
MEWTACPTTTQNKPVLIPYSSITEKVDWVGFEPKTSSISLPICKMAANEEELIYNILCVPSYLRS